jgi:hypothetical protein
MDYRKTITDILEKHDIEFWEEGKNVSEDTVNIQCPICDDHSNHCGIFVSTMVFHCWRCNASGFFSYLLATLTGRSIQQCNEEIEAAGFTFDQSAIKEIQSIFNADNAKTHKNKAFTGLPAEFELVTELTQFPLLMWYLNKRKITLTTIVDHGCGICQSGPYMNRLIIPVIEKGNLVAFQAADLTRKAELKYKNSSAKMDFLYNIDRIPEGGLLILTEGVLDCWRVGQCCVCSFGTHLTDRQKSLIIEKKPKWLIGLWDNDAYWKAVDQMEYFDPFVENIKTVLLPEGHDPDSMGRDAGVNELWNLILEGVE